MPPRTAHYCLTQLHLTNAKLDQLLLGFQIHGIVIEHHEYYDESDDDTTILSATCIDEVDFFGLYATIGKINTLIGIFDTLPEAASALAELTQLLPPQETALTRLRALTQQLEQERALRQSINQKIPPCTGPKRKGRSPQS